MLHQLKYRWQTAIKSLLFLAGFGAYGLVNANHILGGEVSYSSLGGRKFKFQLTMYRNCGDCEFNDGGCADVQYLEVYASPEELSFAKKLGIVPLKKVSRNDITQVCPGALSRCKGQGAGYLPQGIEAWLFEGSVDFDTISVDYCKFEVAIRLDNRPDPWSLGVGESFYNFARVNTCSGLKNSSAVFNAPAFYLLPENQSFTYNLLAKDADGDSLSYNIVKAQKGWGTSVSFPSLYSAIKPVDIYCPSTCDLDKSSWPVEGFGIDAETGWMGFTPVTKNQAGFVVIEVTEWRKLNGVWSSVGVTRRDIEIQITEANNNSPKISSSSLDYFGCAGDTFMVDFGINDAVFNGIKDSVSIYAWSDLPGGAVRKIGNSKNQFDAFYSVPTTLNQIREKPYFITIIARDNGCPLTATTYRTISLKLTGVPKSQSEIKFRECNRVEFKTAATGSEYNSTWYLFQNGNMLESKSGNTGTFEVPKPGKYFIRHQIVNSNTGCETEITDSVTVPFFSLMGATTTWPDKVCKGEAFSLSASFTGGTSAFAYWWNGIVGAAGKSFTLQKDSTIELFVRDANGCRLTITKEIKLFPRVDLQTTDTSMCLPASDYSVCLNNRVNISTDFDVSKLQISYAGSAGQLYQSNGKYFFKPNKAFANQFQVNYTDAHGCPYSATFIVSVLDPTPTGIKDPAPVCDNVNPIDLNLATGCLISGGEWTSLNASAAISNPYFAPKVSKSGNFTLYFKKNISGCVILDTTTIVVYKSPVPKITKLSDSIWCSTAANKNLIATPIGGVWSNNVGSIPGSLFSPADMFSKGFSNGTFVYTATDKTNGCVATDNIKLYVNPKVEISVASTYEVCGGDKLLIDPKSANMEQLQLSLNSPYLKVERLDNAYLIQTEAVNKKEVVLGTLTATGMPGCSDVTKSFSVILKPRPEIAFLASKEVGCAPLTSVLEISNLNTNAKANKFYWLEGQNWVEGAHIKAFTLKASGTYNYTVKAALEGCESQIMQKSLKVLVSPDAIMEITPESRVVSADYTNVVFKDASVSYAPYQRHWEFELGTPPISDKAKVSVDFPKDTGLYSIKLTITTDEGCADHVVSSIRVRPGLVFFAPNAFTPNRKGPDQNESFRIVMDSANSFRLAVYNRWGQRVFESESQNVSWDGTYQGGDVAPGIYVWELEATTIYGTYVLKKGVVSLIR